MPNSRSLTLDADDPFEALVIDAVLLNRKKRKDYAGDSHWLQNFYDSAYQLGQTGGHSVESLIATKQARLRVLLPTLWAGKSKPENESVEDTILDRFVYSGLALGLYREGGYDPNNELVCSWPSE